jgi:hypothetical protein
MEAEGGSGGAASAGATTELDAPWRYFEMDSPGRIIG